MFIVTACCSTVRVV